MSGQHPNDAHEDASTSRRILVTGGAGFVGQHVITTLAERGQQVVALEHRHKLPADVRA